MSDNEERSIARSKQSAAKLADFLAEEATGLVPGGASIYKVGKLLVGHAREFYSDRREKRLEDFHRKILGEGDKNYWDDIKDKEFSFDVYYSLLNFVIQDEEEQKIDFYAKLFRLILLGKIPEKYRTHIIRSARELKFSDLELLRQLYINEKYEFVGPGHKLSQIAALTQADSPLKLYSIQTLIRFGYLSDRKETKPAWPTKLLTLLVESIFDESELKA